MDKQWEQRMSCIERQAEDGEGRFVTLAQKSPEDFVILYDQYVQPVYRYLYSKVGSKEEAEDLTSQVFLSAIERLPRYTHRGSFAAWLFAIARNKAADFYRRQRITVPIETVVGPADNPEPLEQVVREDEINRIRHAIRSLPEEEQELIRLRFVASLSFSQMAEILRKKEDTVKKQLYRLLGRLKHRLEDKNE